MFAGSGPEPVSPFGRSPREDFTFRTFVYSLYLSSLLFISVRYSVITVSLTMPDVSKHETVLQDVKNGNIPTLGVSIGPVTITPGQKIAKAGENTKLTHARYIFI